MEPDALAKAGTESAIQQALFCWLAKPKIREKLPEGQWLYHIPNGGSRGDTDKTRKIAGGLLKAEGVKKGVWDLALDIPNFGSWHGLKIEMKKPEERNKANGGLTPEQIVWGTHYNSQGYATYICYTWREAANVLLSYLGKNWRVQDGA